MFVLMEHAYPVDAELLIAVELEAIHGDSLFLTSHPAVRYVGAAHEGGFTVWIDDCSLPLVRADGLVPDRPPEVEIHGPGKPCEALTQHPRAEYAEMFIDALGDPEAAPRGWWHARVWLKAD